MKIRIITTLVTGFLLLLSVQSSAAEKEARPADSRRMEGTILLLALPDTIPAVVQQPATSPAKPVAEKPVSAVIKAVPKARRVSVPKPVQVKVKPVKVIKPRIVRPVLKVL